VVTRYYINPTTGRFEIHGVSRDITARRQAEAEIRQLNASLEQRVDARTAELHQANQALVAACTSKMNLWPP